MQNTLENKSWRLEPLFSNVHFGEEYAESIPLITARIHPQKTH